MISVTILVLCVGPVLGSLSEYSAPISPIVGEWLFEFMNVCKDSVQSASSFFWDLLVTKAYLWNTAVRTSINATQDVHKINDQGIDSIAQTYLNAFEHASEESARIVEQVMNDEAEAWNSAFRDMQAAIQSVYNESDPYEEH